MSASELSEYDRLGWIYFPITFHPCKHDKKGVDKRPSFPTKWTSRTTSERGKNVAILTGKPSNLTVVDFDDVEGYMEACRVAPELLERYTVRTKRGYHIYFEYDEELKSEADCFTISHVDIRNDGGCAIAPPSSYTFEGVTYEYELQGGEMGAMPHALREKITERGIKRVESEPENAVIPYDATDESLREVVMGLDKRRADHRGEWIKVGMALHHAGQDVEIWNEFSKQSPKYRWGDCEREWRSFRGKSGLTERTLWWMLREDNIEEFKRLVAISRNKERKYQLLEDAGIDGHRYLAEHFVSCKTDEYLYDTESGWWYMEKNKTWKNSMKAYPPSLFLGLSRTLFDEVSDYTKIFRDKTNRGEDVDAYSMMRMKSSIKLRENLLKSGFVKSIMEFCQALYAEQTQIRLEQYNVSSVQKLMDSNQMLFAFQDSVYDFTLEGDQPIGQRMIEPTDYIATTCGYPYPVRNSTAIHEVEEALKTIWSRQGEYGDDGETYEYMMKMLSTALCGTRWCEAFYIMTGSGRNGKGLLFELVKYTLGDYYYTAAIQILTTKLTDSTSATPELARLKGKRMIMTTEPEVTERLQEGTIKAMTGGDEITGRALYSEAVKFKLQGFLGLQCNTIPLFNGVTRGGVLRNVVIPFPYEFCDKPTTDRQKQGDPVIKNSKCKSVEWRDGMWYILLDRFESIRERARDAIEVPRMVRERTEEYMQENNGVGQWWERTYERVEDSYVLTRGAYQAYRAETEAVMTDKQFKAALEFNLLEPRMITSRTWNNGLDRGKMGIKGWRARVQE